MNAVVKRVARSTPAVDSARLGRLAIASLHAELTLAPKPGLVTPFDRGSHNDMDASVVPLLQHHSNQAAGGGGGSRLLKMTLQGAWLTAEESAALHGMSSGRFHIAL